MEPTASVCGTRQEKHTRGVGYLIGGLALVALSAAINIRHTIAHSTDHLDMLLSGGLALAMTIAFVVLPAFAAGAIRDRLFGFATAAWIGVIICGGISLTNIAGASLGQRLVVSAEAGDAVRKRADATKLIEKHGTALASLETSRPAAAINAEISAKMTSRNDLDGCEAKWLVSSKARGVCIEVHQLRGELAKAEEVAGRRSLLESKVSDARATMMGTAASSTVGSGDTAAIIAAGRKFSWELDGETVDLVKSVGLALGVELFAALLFVAWERARQAQHPASSSVDVPACAPSHAVVATGETLPLTVAADIGPRVPALECLRMPALMALATDLAPVLVPVSPEPDAPNDDAVLAALRARGGSLVASQRAMADLFGMSRSSVNRGLHDLAAAGRVKVLATARGTAVTLVEPSAKLA